MISNIEKGRKGENLAKNYLIKSGYKILESNFRSKVGEVDIIALKGNILIFIEVKSRTSLNFGYPYESVNYNKQQKIINTSMSYIKYKKLTNIQCRYDIIEVYLTKNIRINHIENAFCL